MLARPAVLAAFGYSAEQTTTALQFFGSFVGFGGLDTVEPDDAALRRVADRRPRALEEAPFLQPLLFLLLCRRLPLLALADCLARARFGFWSADRRTFFPDLPAPHAAGLRWAVRTIHTHDLGRSYLFRGTTSTLYASTIRGPRRASGREAISWIGVRRRHLCSGCRW